jgi:acetylornithine deacetylase
MSATEIKFEETNFVQLLTDLLKHCESLQNQPPRKTPQEELAADEVLAFLAPYTGADGPLEIKKCTYVPGRSNVIVSYKSANPDAKTVSFVGSHMDVVSAAPEDWSFNPFELKREGDKVFGRGVTDCLGHVALLAHVFQGLAIAKPVLDVNVVAVFIANEEASDVLGVGVDKLMSEGELDSLKSGPLFWVDSADMGPTLATAGAVAWEITIGGKKFHSGLPHKGINAVELGMEVIKYVQERFYKDYAPHEKESEYKFAIGSSLKPTQFNTAPGPNNQVPQSVVISGDIRITPFYDVDAVKASVEKYMEELDVTTLPSYGFSKYALPTEGATAAAKGTAVLKWQGEAYHGVACKLDSPGYLALYESVDTIVPGGAKPFSLTGSLPLIRELQNDGFDVQVVGFGRMDAYHAVDEYASLSDFERGFRIVMSVLDKLSKSMKP